MQTYGRTSLRLDLRWAYLASYSKLNTRNSSFMCAFLNGKQLNLEILIHIVNVLSPSVVISICEVLLITMTKKKLATLQNL